MIKLLVIGAALGAVLADGNFGYHYNVPQTSYGTPSYQVTGNVASYNKNNYQNTAHVGTSGGQQNTGYYSGLSSSYPAQSAAGVGYTTGGGSQTVQSIGTQQGNGGTGFQYTSLIGAGNQQTSAGNGQYAGQYSNSASNGNQYSGSIGSGSQNTISGGHYSVPTASLQYTVPASQGGYSNYNQYQESSAVHKYQEQYSQVQQQPAQIFKHFYVHAAPEEPETPQFRQPIVVPPPQKHYQIIFIKTPTQKTAVPQYIPAPQKEEKTLVYVLVNKNEEQQQVVLPKVEPTKPHKPEVFFIKYNSKEGSQAVINNIVNDYNKGNTVSVSGDEVYTGHSSVQSGQGAVSSGQYAQTTGNEQYASSLGSDVSQNIGHAGQYTVSSDAVVGLGSGQYSQGGESSQSSQSTSSGQYAGNSGLYTQSSGIEQYGTPLADTNGGSQTFSQASATQSGLASSGSSSEGQAQHGSSDSGISGSISFDNSAGSGISYNTQAGSSQGLPHQTYGLPNFRD